MVAQRSVQLQVKMHLLFSKHFIIQVDEGAVQLPPSMAYRSL